MKLTFHITKSIKLAEQLSKEEGLSYTESKIGKLDTCYHISIDTTNDKAMYSLFLYTLDIEHFYRNEGWDKGWNDCFDKAYEAGRDSIEELLK